MKDTLIAVLGTLLGVIILALFLMFPLWFGWNLGVAPVLKLQSADFLQAFAMTVFLAITGSFFHTRKDK